MRRSCPRPPAHAGTVGCLPTRRQATPGQARREGGWVALALRGRRHGLGAREPALPTCDSHACVCDSGTSAWGINSAYSIVLATGLLGGRAGIPGRPHSLPHEHQDYRGRGGGQVYFPPRPFAAAEAIRGSWPFCDLLSSRFTSFIIVVRLGRGLLSHRLSPEPTGRTTMAVTTGQYTRSDTTSSSPETPRTPVRSPRQPRTTVRAPPLRLKFAEVCPPASRSRAVGGG